MLSTLHTYLASLPADHTVAAVTLGAVTPLLLLVLAGFAFCHAADVAAGRSWRQ